MLENNEVANTLNDSDKKQLKIIGQDMKDYGVRDISAASYEAFSKAPSNTPAINNQQNLVTR